MTPLSPEEERESRKRFRKGLTVALSTIGWFVLTCGLLLWDFGSNFCLDAQSCEANDADGLTSEDQWAIVIVIALLALGVLVLLPFALGMMKTGAVYAIIAMAIVCALAQHQGTRDAFRPDPSPTTEYKLDPDQCIPRSGGDSECPGG